MMKSTASLRLLLALAGVAFLATACSKSDHAAHDHDKKSAHSAHVHVAPHGGNLVDIGDHVFVAGEVITSKRGELESKDLLKRRIAEAAKYAPLDQLALSPQCGFASTEEGNTLTVEEQWAKLARCVEVAQEVWGSL